MSSLAGRSIIVTRPRHQADSLKRSLEALGANVVLAPAITIVPPSDYAPLDDALARAQTYDWIVFTSVNGVEVFFARCSGARNPASGFFGAAAPPCRYAAIGPATAEALSEHGIDSAVVPERFVAEELFQTLAETTDLSGLKILLPRADIAREALPKLLRGAGADVDVVVAYRTVPATDDIARAAKLVRERAADAVTFTSGSTVRSFFAAADEDVREHLVPASIGPITSAALREQDIEPVIEAERYTVDGLVEAIRKHFE